VLNRPLLWEEPALPDRATKSESAILPIGTVTVLILDVEACAGQRDAYSSALASAMGLFDSLVAQTAGRYSGVRPVAHGEGNSFIAAFSRASDALACALALQLAALEQSWPGGIDLRPRVALHTGEVQHRDEGDHIGAAINRSRRLRAIGHKGQTLLSRATHDLVADRLPADVTVSYLGTYRLRDLARPEDVYQVNHPSLPAEFPPLRSLDALPNNLPARLSSFIGRESEMASLKEILAENRLVTLTGAGGVGKTRLGLQLAADTLDGHPDGVWWVDLARITDGGLVPSAVAAALNVKEVPGQRLVDTLQNNLRSKRLLILLDNCEHLVVACAEVAAALLRACPSLSILTTSREPLAVEGETAWRVPSLTLPDEKALPVIESLSQYEAVRLFIERAIAVRPNFQVTNENAPAVAHICQRLDGIPLAVELAAARTRMMSAEQIADGLMDRFRLLTGGDRTVLPRQQTLQASVDWSYNLLSGDERTLLSRLSAFVGSFTLDAAEHVGAADGLDPQQVLELLSHLVDRSLVQVEDAPGEARYRLLETIRQYGHDRLDETGEEAAVRGRHLDFYIGLAEHAEWELEGPGLFKWLERLDLELGNLRSALDWSIHIGDPDEALRLVAPLRLFWTRHGDLSEGLRRFEAAVSLAGGAPLLRARALVAASELASNYGNMIFTRDAAEEALAIARELGDKRGMGRALGMMGYAVTFLDPPAAPALFEAAVALSREAGDTYYLAMSLRNLGQALWPVGKIIDSRSHFQEALSIARPAGDRIGVELTLGQLGLALGFVGELSEAQAALNECLAIAHELNDRFILAAGSAGLAGVATHQGDYDRAAELLQESMAQAREFSPFIVSVTLLYQGLLDYALGNLEDAGSNLQQAVNMTRAMRTMFAHSWGLCMLGDTALARGDLERSSAIVEEALDVGRRTGDFALGLVLQKAGKLARAQGDHERAEATHHDALTLLQKSGAKVGGVEALESLAGLAALAESPAEAARLFGAAEALRESIGYVRFPIDRTAHEADAVLVGEALTEEEFQRAWQEGRAMSMDEAIAYASRGRGERKRPSTGWASLTPSELQVVRLVAEGLSNPRIGERLFISRRTVQTHLKHVFAKLGVSSRAELASEVTRKQL
jgi:predicted ATPase/class 3 adenylate cyclase/DNA-binding CsgD family transcriptional regulator